jgi:hypothetical protein
MTEKEIAYAKLLAQDERMHPKKRDALEALRLATSSSWVELTGDERLWLTDRSL